MAKEAYGGTQGLRRVSRQGDLVVEARVGGEPSYILIHLEHESGFRTHLIDDRESVAQIFAADGSTYVHGNEQVGGEVVAAPQALKAVAAAGFQARESAPGGEDAAAKQGQDGSVVQGRAQVGQHLLAELAGYRAPALAFAGHQHLFVDSIGYLSVLHTWGQNLSHHPHIHCVVPGGGLSPDGASWVSTRKGFFLPVRVLSRLFRGLFLHSLQQAFAAGQLHFSGSLAHLADQQALR